MFLCSFQLETDPTPIGVCKDQERTLELLLTENQQLLIYKDIQKKGKSFLLFCYFITQFLLSFLTFLENAEKLAMLEKKRLREEAEKRVKNKMKENKEEQRLRCLSLAVKSQTELLAKVKEKSNVDCHTISLFEGFNG